MSLSDPRVQETHDATSDIVSGSSFHNVDVDSMNPDTIEADMSVDLVSQMMREQDADLLESMHYAASQVSQYSPGGTPVLRPLDRSLPIDDVPLLHIPSAQSMLKSESRSTSFASESVANNLRIAGIRPNAFDLDFPGVLKRATSMGSKSVLPLVEANESVVEGIDGQKFRRLLSGEVRALDDDDGGGEPHVAEEETTASPVSVAQEATTAIKTDQDSGLAERRRKSEALQFAEAVGEDISINRDDLCIIEDHTDAEGNDDTDDEAIEPKEIIVTDDLDLLGSETLHSQKSVRVQEPQPTLPSHVDVRQKTSYGWRRKSKRPMWPFSDDNNFLDSLSDGVEKNNFVYKGICANPPEITKRGIQRGNYAQLHRKAWLEVSDKYHRYGKNLRLYYRYWERLSFPTNSFFDWLDSKGEAAGQPLPNMDECPRSVLDSDTVLYISNPDVTDGYALEIIAMEDGRGRVVDVDGEAVCTGIEGWIFVLRDNVMYGAEKITSITGLSKQRFHHSSFFGGKAVASAGIIITDEEGLITRLYPHSGHYRPSEAHMQRMLFFLHRKGVDLRTFAVDTQQFRRVSREKEVKTKDKDGKSKDKEVGEKKKKVDSVHLEKAVHVACFLSHKASFIGNGIFERIHKIRRADVTSVSEALEMVDDGGFWYAKE